MDMGFYTLELKFLLVKADYNKILMISFLMCKMDMLTNLEAYKSENPKKNKKKDKKKEKDEKFFDP